MHPYQSILASLLLLVATTEATTPLEYISPFQLCQRLHANQTGFYCHPLFPRGYLHCPSGVEDVCPPTTLCVDTRAGDVPVVVVTTVVNTTVTEINTVMTTFDNETVAVDGDGAVDTNDTTPVDSSDTSNEDTVDTSLTSSSSPPSIQCLPDPNDPIVEQCKNALPNTSRCLDDHTVVECDVREALPCPSDMKCQRRGGRAYCVQPRFITPEGESDATGDGELDVCKGYQETVNQMVNSSTPYPPELSVCHPWNLKKKIDCPSGRVQICPNGHMCDVGDQKNSSSTDFVMAQCVPFQQNVRRFCSNKPLYSSHCLPGTQGLFVLCSHYPRIVQCPGRGCIQSRSITARCTVVPRLLV